MERLSKKKKRERELLDMDDSIVRAGVWGGGHASGRGYGGNEW